jgi:hypothetical protein
MPASTPNKLVSTIDHERMPVLLTREDQFDTWLNGAPHVAFALAQEYPPGQMRIVRRRAARRYTRGEGGRQAQRHHYPTPHELVLEKTPGQVDTTVRLTIRREGEYKRLELTLARKMLRLNSVCCCAELQHRISRASRIHRAYRRTE